MSTIVPVILSGGSGTRLWPMSRELTPKQLLPLVSERTLLQETALRATGRPIVVCNHETRFIIAEQLREVGIEARTIVIEPTGRNTAPAIAISAMLVDAEPDAMILVMPSDHVIRDAHAFAQAVEQAAALARDGCLVTFGIQPAAPHTGYGYIHRGAPLAGGFRVDRFVEKPDRPTAEKYVASGEYYWNSGIFLFPARLLLSELTDRAPDLVAGCRTALERGQTDMFFTGLEAASFGAIKGQSIDYALMEHTTKAAVVPVDMGWSDLGSWSAIWDEGEKDEADNVTSGDVIALESSGCYLRSEKTLVATVGVSDLVVVATDDAVLVTSKECDQGVRAIADRLKATGRSEATHGSRVWRPWGWFQTVDKGPRYKVKHIKVDPGAKLSLQKHWHRSEHWVVVTGTALVTCGDQTLVLRENESTYIPCGTPHRLENPGLIPLRIIEVQSGEYVGEDDIVRIEDVYGR